MFFVRYIDSHRIEGILFLIAFAISSCAPARYVPEGEYLLSKNKIDNVQKKIPEDQLKSYIIQKPNKKLFGFRFYLFLYNLSNINKEKWPHNWLRRIGEEPVIYNPGLTESSTGQLKQYLENKGYYHAEVKDTVTFRGRNARALYTVKANNSYRISNISYFFEDTGLVSFILPDTLNSLLKKRGRFDKDIMQQERLRLENLLKEKGFYYFSKEYIFYTATLDPEDNTVDLEIRIREFVEGRPDPRTKVKRHHQYKIGNVFVYPEYSVLDNTTTRGTGSFLTDTNHFQGQYFINAGKPALKPAVIANNSYIIPGEYYKLSNVSRTYRNLSDLSIIRYTNITFRDHDSLKSIGSKGLLDCHIEMAQKKRQSYQTEIAGTNSASDLGIRGNLLYQNLNLFRGAEVFNMKFTGAIEALKNRSDGKYRSMNEVGAETSIVFPKFFSPLRLQSFVKKYQPKTSFSVSFNYQSRPDYTRSIANSSFSYRWKGNPYLTHTIWPLELSYVNIFQNLSSAEFLDSIRNTPLGYSFEDHTVNVARYGFELNNQSIGKRKDFYFTRFTIESAGNLVNLSSRILNKGDREEPYNLLKVPYFQYMRGDVEFSYYNIVDRQNTFVYHFFIGLGYPYGNSTTLPYEKKYFAGGPNSIRGWNTRDLGPGSYVEKDTTLSSVFYYPNKNGDMKIEANIEYRFKVVWKLEGALFLDVGNIWAVRKEDDKPGAEFNWNRFHKEIAVGSGFGARFDFSFFLLRLDFGIKLRDPALPDGDRWIPVFKDFGLRDLHVKFGIGYPF
ncbi:MAG: BamA/TamA family outer membrane protein [Bacteroidales bacterium]|nr:BamA/TamA family outer membrane protein [Bacteroidales bacterium]